MEIQDKNIILVLVGAVLGIAIILILLNIITKIFGGLMGGYRRDYPNYEEREPRRSGCFIPLLLLVGFLVFGAKTIRDQGFLKPSIAVVKAEQPAANTNPTATNPTVPPQPIIYGDDPEFPDAPEADDDEDDEQSEKGQHQESEPYNPHLIQTDFFYDATNAERRMAELAQYDLEVGMYLKLKDGRTGYAVYVGPFNNRPDAMEMLIEHGLKGDVVPSYGLHLLRYQGN